MDIIFYRVLGRIISKYFVITPFPAGMKGVFSYPLSLAFARKFTVNSSQAVEHNQLPALPGPVMKRKP